MCGLKGSLIPVCDQDDDETTELGKESIIDDSLRQKRLKQHGHAALMLLIHIAVQSIYMIRCTHKQYVKAIDLSFLLLVG